MAITKTNKVENITILVDGEVVVSTAAIIVDDGKEVSRKVEQQRFKPGADISEQPEKVKAICTVAWQGKV